MNRFGFFTVRSFYLTVSGGFISSSYSIHEKKVVVSLLVFSRRSEDQGGKGRRVGQTDRSFEEEE